MCSANTIYAWSYVCMYATMHATSKQEQWLAVNENQTRNLGHFEISLITALARLSFVATSVK